MSFRYILALKGGSRHIDNKYTKVFEWCLELHFEKQSCHFLSYWANISNRRTINVFSEGPQISIFFTPGGALDYTLP